MSRLRMCLPLAAVLLASLAPAAADAPALESEDQKTLYALGLALAQRLAPLQLSDTDVQTIRDGFVDGASGNEAKVSLETYGPKIDPLLQQRLGQIAERERAAGLKFLEAQAKAPGAERSDSGLVFVQLAPGAGESPKADSTVKVHYQGTLRDGEVFDTSRDGDPAQFSLAAVAPCFAEGVGKMKIGGKSKLICPPELAYGDRGFPPMIPPGATIAFEVELLEILAAAPATPVLSTPAP